MSYALRLSRAADAYLQRLDGKTQQRVERRLTQIAGVPQDPRFSKPLSDAAGVRASRVGGWRILFYVDEAARIVEVTEVGPRGEVYRRL